MGWKLCVGRAQSRPLAQGTVCRGHRDPRGNSSVMPFGTTSSQIGEPPALVDKPGAPRASPPRWAPVGLATKLEHSTPYRIGFKEQNSGMDEQDQGQGSKRLWGDVASCFPRNNARPDPNT